MSVTHTLKGVGAPTQAPPSDSAHYLDTATGTTYLATGTTGAEDWVAMATRAEVQVVSTSLGGTQSAVAQLGADVLSNTEALQGKVDVVPGKGLSTEDYTALDKAKLASLEGSHYRGTFLSLPALQAAVPTGVPGDYADVDSGVGTEVARYVWDASDNEFVVQKSEPTALTAAQVKTLYESNADTNAFTDGEKTKLSGLAPGIANPMLAAGDMIVAGGAGAPERLAAGTNGKVLKVVDGTPAWADEAGGGGGGGSSPLTKDSLLKLLVGGIVGAQNGAVRHCMDKSLGEALTLNPQGFTSASIPTSAYAGVEVLSSDGGVVGFANNVVSLGVTTVDSRAGVKVVRPIMDEPFAAYGGVDFFAASEIDSAVFRLNATGFLQGSAASLWITFYIGDSAVSLYADLTAAANWQVEYPGPSDDYPVVDTGVAVGALGGFTHTARIKDVGGVKTFTIGYGADETQMFSAPVAALGVGQKRPLSVEIELSMPGSGALGSATAYDLRAVYANIVPV